MGKINYVKTQRTIPDFELEESFWWDLYINEKEKEPANEVKLENFKDVRYPIVILFLSYIYNGHHWGVGVSEKFNPSKKKFKSCNSKVLEVWMGTRKRNSILKVLEDHKYIMIDHSYVISNSNAFLKSKSKGYMIHPQFYDSNIYSKKKYILKVKENTLKRFTNPFDYLKFPKDKYSKIHEEGVRLLKIDNDKFDAIYDHLKEVKPSSVKNKEYIYQIKKRCNEGTLDSYKSYKRNNSGQRIYNNLQSLNAEFRYAYDFGEDKREVEIRNEVPFLLSLEALKINEDLTADEKGSIKREISNEVEEFKQSDRDFDDLEYDELKGIIKRILENLGFNDGWKVLTSEQLNARLGKRFKTFKDGKSRKTQRRHDCSREMVKSIDLIIFLTTTVFANSYRFLSDFAKEENVSVFNDSDYMQIKKTINRYFNQNNYQRDKVSEITLNRFLNYYFPNLYNLLREYGYSNKKLHYLLFNYEAKMILEDVLPKFQNESPNEPFVGMHDGVICRASSAERFRELIYNYSITEYGIPAPLTIKIIDNPMVQSNYHSLDR